MIKLAIVYLLLINALGLIIMITDKSRSRKRMRRISEAALFTVALIGGSFGVIFAMITIRHKTRHRKFTIGMPLILAFQILLLLFLLLF